MDIVNEAGQGRDAAESWGQDKTLHSWWSQGHIHNTEHTYFLFSALSLCQLSIPTHVCPEESRACAFSTAMSLIKKAWICLPCPWLFAQLQREENSQGGACKTKISWDRMDSTVFLSLLMSRPSTFLSQPSANSSSQLLSDKVRGRAGFCARFHTFHLRRGFDWSNFHYTFSLWTNHYGWKQTRTCIHPSRSIVHQKPVESVPSTVKNM